VTTPISARITGSYGDSGSDEWHIEVLAGHFLDTAKP
jgi:hypothetical protein